MKNIFNLKKENWIYNSPGSTLIWKKDKTDGQMTEFEKFCFKIAIIYCYTFLILFIQYRLWLISSGGRPTIYHVGDYNKNKIL